MSEEQAVANATETTTANAEQTQEAVAQSAQSEVNERLLNESKKYKKAYQEEKQKREELEKSELQKQAKYKELYEQTEAKYNGLYKSLVKEKVKSTVADKAAKAGCLDVDALLQLGNASLLQVDEETLEVLGADTFVEEAKKSKPYLFQSAKAPTINATTPGGTPLQKKMTLNEMARKPNTDPSKASAWNAAFQKLNK